MTVALDRDDFGHLSEIEADEAGKFHVDAPQAHARFVQIVARDGAILLLPWDSLEDAEKALLTNDQLQKDTLEGLAAFESGEGVSSDWLFDDE